EVEQILICQGYQQYVYIFPERDFPNRSNPTPFEASQIPEQHRAEAVADDFIRNGVSGARKIIQAAEGDLDTVAEVDGITLLIDRQLLGNIILCI
ncbi:MAG: hypothetical protein NTY20_03630, partial [Candidatus Aenigmarchaeota archaeon]|nr:hypothetical protein [Candidatus Aenigmarchaeota archaeon]